MKCQINTLKEMRDVLVDGANAASDTLESVGFDGESFALTAKFYKRLTGLLNNPDQVFAELENRAAELKNPFHTNLRREVGEVVYLEKNGKAVEYYVTQSNIVQSPDSLGGVQVELSLVPATNIASIETFRANLDGDTVYVEGNPAGKITDLGNLLQKAVARTLKADKSALHKKPKIDHQNDKDLKSTLTKMAQADKILHSRQNRSSESLKGYEQITDYEHGNIDSMKSILMKLHVLGKSKASPAMLSYYNQLLESMHPRFFNKMQLWLKKKGVDSYGQVNFGTNNIQISVNKKNKTPVRQTEAEVYLHEVIHTMTYWALQQTDGPVNNIKLQLNHVMATAKAKIRWQDLLDVAEDVATKEQINEAKSLQNYLFAKERSVDEFIAYTLTNPKLMELTKAIPVTSSRAASESIFETVVEFFVKLMNVVAGRINFRDAETNVFDKVNDLTFQLAEINVRHQAQLKKMNPVGAMMEVLEDADGYLAGKLEDIKDKVKNTDKTIETPPAGADVFQQAKFYVKFGVAVLTNPVYRGFLGLHATAWKIKPNGTLREILGGFFEKSQQFRAAEMLNLLRNRVDAARNSIINAASKAIKDSFTKELTEEEDTALTRVLLQSNLASLAYNRSGRKKRAYTDLSQLLTDNDYRYEQIGRLKHQIKDTLKKEVGRGNWVAEQAVSLGYYMATGKAHVAQNFNGAAIVRGIGLNERFKADAALEALIEELAVLVAVEHTNAKDRTTVAALIKTEKKGVRAVTDAFESYRRASAETVFKGKKLHMMSGHIAEVFDDTIDVTVAPVSEAHAMSKKGYTLQYELEAKNGDTYTSPMALYTTGTWGKAGRAQGTVGLGKLHAKGTEMRALKRMADPYLAEATHGRDFARVQAESIRINKLMAEGKFDVTKVAYGMAPVIDPAGKVVDYRYMMSKERKEDLLGQDLRASQVLPRSMAGLTYQMRNYELNNQALSLIQEDMADNWEQGTVGKDRITEYSLIGPKVADPAMRELYAMLPDEFKQLINSRSDKQIAVRSELLNVYFGVKNIKISNAIGLRLLPQFLRDSIDIIEGVWKEFVKVSKGAILLKMPLVLIYNFISNVRYQINTGSVDIVQLIKDYKASFREVNEYLNYNRKAIALRLEIQRDQEALRRVQSKKVTLNKLQEKRTELARIETALAANPAKELFDAGFYQSHIEDLDNVALNEANKLSRAVSNKLDKAPMLVQQAGNLAYLTQNTAWYKFSQEALQRTDMVTRLVDNKREIRKENRMAEGELRLPRWWTKDKGANYPEKKKMSQAERQQFLVAARKVRLEYLLDSYVNYTLPNGPVEEYLNSMGILMFTKYLKRIQSVIVNTTMQHPIKTALTYATAGLVPVGDMIQDQALMAKGFSWDGEFNLSNLVPIYDPMYHLENVLTPAIVKPELWLNSF